MELSTEQIQRSKQKDSWDIEVFRDVKSIEDKI